MNGIHLLCVALFHRMCPCNQLKTGTRNEAKDSKAQGMIMAPFTAVDHTYFTKVTFFNPLSHP